ncbi:MAG: hypothetical protein AVDCRST_MAG87-215 [uncultured Thermomicrobiales bacterium]|uniref:Uncharacterized protein n=1 Tax=uncultured Thermomicrobiales bacterium TaxID=1645740 RepID=A0A6J4U7V6_9BACT|nr:MAG: hypothetical protein AVDCRST_MAG87-215 [uncultured Thermomicrobiales bacterium]
MDQGGNSLLEDCPVGNAEPVAAQRMRRGHRRTVGQHDGELLPDGLQQRYWHGRRGILQRDSELASLSSPGSCLFH